MRHLSHFGLITGAMLTLAGLASPGPAKAQHDDDDDDDPLKGLDFDMAAPGVRAGASLPARSATMGATPGGAQDIDYARDRIMAGEIPHPNTFTPEGLFSQYDLPLDTGRECKQLLCLTAAATRADLVAQPEVRFLAQIGFASRLDANTWKRDPLNLVVVVDRSGSMQGAPLETVKESLLEVSQKLGPRDRLSIVVFNHGAEVLLPPTPADDAMAIAAAIRTIASDGGTAVEAGLALGFDVAQRSKDAFRGTTRVMLFTDERPNVGATDKGSFMAMARAASADGIGLTTIGVATHFGAELATATASVRGGNLFFFPDVAAMRKEFEENFDTMVTELAYDMHLQLRPVPGHELAGIYGIPGDLVKRIPGGGVEVTIETIFLSREKGGIFFAFSPGERGALPAPAGPIAEVSLSYVEKGGRRQSDRLEVLPWANGPLPLGLARGKLLVDEITALKKSASLHLERNDQEGAYRLVHALSARFRQNGVTGLEREANTVGRLEQTLTRLSGHGGEAAGMTRLDRVTGLPVR